MTIHILVFNKSEQRHCAFERADFAYDDRRDLYTCPAGKELRSRQDIGDSEYDVRTSST
ncbi:hypothetical protein [Rhizobium lusitanum]|uniref:hypothetical protein n=1 Tax=Rhizobium lusitanum TaxID=293958 RepID=UPI000B28BB1E|nr:hypothetical protein [Rhizobium lusitanum]